MINALEDLNGEKVKKDELVLLEEKMLRHLGFDFNFPGPVQLMERYMRILNYDLNKTVMDMVYQICKFQLNDALFLKYKPS
jgi:hypothetical protein